MIDFHSHYQAENAIVNSALLLPNFYSVENEEKVFSSSDWHVGEFGLDKRYVDIVGMDRQLEIFEHLLIRAKNEGKAVSIHCVQCTQKAIDVIKKVAYSPNKILWHSFSGSPETAYILNKLGVIISFSPFSSCNLLSVAKANPNFVIETDFEGNDEKIYRQILNEQYEKVSKLLNLTIEELEEHCESIYKTFKN